MFYAGQATRRLGDREFLQTPRGRISPYLGFIPIIKCFTNVSVVWSRERPCDRSQNLGPNL